MVMIDKIAEEMLMVIAKHSPFSYCQLEAVYLYHDKPPFDVMVRAVDHSCKYNIGLNRAVSDLLRAPHMEVLDSPVQ